jgi:ABC-2 type transport system permease protein
MSKTAFIKKEFMEHARTYKLLIMLIVFTAFGIISPLTAKLTPEIIEAALPENVTIIFPEPTALDSWTQFFKNISQMGLIVTVIIFNGVTSNEISKGTLVILLTKGLSRVNVILSKAVCIALVWTACLLITFAITWGYTEYLFETESVKNLLFSVFCLWLFGIWLSAVLMLSASAIKNAYGSLLITGGVIVACMLVNLIPGASRFNPVMLASFNMDLLTGATEPAALMSACVLTTGLTAACLCLAVVIFKKRQL